MKVSEYITDFLLAKHVHKVFSVTGGFAMHLNDSFGRRMDVTYTHGENPAGYAALGWSSVDREPSVCCVTSGCGATNAVTPCLIAYQDSVPVFFVSGQVQKDVNIHSRGGQIRGYFCSDCDIVECVKGFTKFSHELRDPRDIHTVLETCWSHLTTGRLGPVWLSVPVDVQSMEVPATQAQSPPCPSLSQEVPTEFKLMWSRSRRPLILAGNGIHISKTREAFRKFIEFHKVPYVVSYFGSDLGDDYIGKVGIIGDRAGNFAIQNADLVVCLGCRLSKTITGYNRDLFAREAAIVCVDIDESENIADKKIDMFLHCDLVTFFSVPLPAATVDPEWTRRTQQWRSEWTYVLPPPNTTCPYYHLDSFFRQKPGDTNVVASSGSIVCVQWHMYRFKPGDRYIPSGHGDMGYEIPVSIGVSMKNGRRTFCLLGDGSFQYSIQDLQTLKQNRLPVTIMVFNNGGYGAIQITQQAMFKKEFGTTPESDLTFCDIYKIATAYDIPYYSVLSAGDVEYLAHVDGPLIVEIVCKVTERYPKVSNKLLADGTFKNMPHEDMYPFLSEEELSKNMFVKELK